MNTQIFNERERYDKTPCRYFESDFEFYDRVQNKCYNEFRNVIEQWYSTYPEEHKHKFDWKNAFKESFFELLIFNFFRCLGYNVSVDVPIEGTDKTPDFLCSNKNFRFHVEVTIVKDKSVEQEKLENLKKSIYIEIEKVKTKDFIYVVTKFEVKKRKGLSGKLLKKQLKEFVENNDIDVVENTLYENRPKFKFEDESMILNIEIIPKKKEFREDFTDRIGMTEAEAKFCSQDVAIGRSIKKKINKYKNSKAPLLICINYTDGIYLNESDIAKKIYSSEDNYSVNLKEYENVIGVMVTSIFPSNLHVAKSTFFANPNRSSKFPELLSLFRIYNLEDDNRDEEKKQVISKVLNINKEWFRNVWDEEEHFL